MKTLLLIASTLIFCILLSSCPNPLLGDGWTLRYRTVIEKDYDGSGAYLQRRSFDGDTFYLAGCGSVLALSKEGKQIAAFPINTTIQWPDHDYPCLEYMTLRGGDLFVGVTDDPWHYGSLEVHCFNPQGGSLKWKYRVATNEVDYFTVEPQVWNGYTFTIFNVSNIEWEFVIKAIDLGNPSAVAIERRYPYRCKSVGSEMVMDDKLWISGLDQDLIRLDLAKFIDPGYADSECIDFVSPELTQRNTRERNIYFTGDDYIGRFDMTVQRRRVADDSVIWSRPIDYELGYYGSALWTLSGDSLVIPSEGGKVVCLDADTGAVRWHNNTWVANDGVGLNNIEAQGCIIAGKWYAQYSSSYCTITLFDLQTGKKLLEFEGNFFDQAVNNLWSEGTRLYHASATEFSVYDIVDPRPAALFMAALPWAGGGAGLLCVLFIVLRVAAARKRKASLPAVAILAA